MAHNRTRDPSDLGAFQSELQRGYLLLSSATIDHTHLFLILKRAAQWFHDARHARCTSTENDSKNSSSKDS